MSMSKGVSAPFALSTHAPLRRADALLARAIEDFGAGRLADALIAAEGLARAHPSAPEPAVLRAKILQACRPTLAPSAWLAAWSRDPLDAALQDAMLQAWLHAGASRRAARQGAAFLPQRCQAGTEADLLGLLAQAGVQRTGACWRSGDAIEVRAFDLTQTGACTRIVVAGEHSEQVYEMPTGGSLRVPVGAGVWSVTFESGGILAGSPVVFDEARRRAVGRIEPGVDIIVPVHRDALRVRACLDSVLDSLPHNRTSARVLVINDASPEAPLVLSLESLAMAGRIELLHNRFNLGFIETVNRALRATRRNALLLNADTLVHGNWIDRMAAALESAPDIASVMPWSNNGEIASVVSGGSQAPSSRDELARIDAAAASLHARGIISDMEVPTASGFAMLMRRRAIARVGLFDGAGLARGYLEEVDWCLRARSDGWRHLLATGVFVAHEGTASFGTEKQLRVRQNRAVVAARYPSYHIEYARFLQGKRLAEERARLLEALADFGVTWPGAAKASNERIEPNATLSAAPRRIAVWQLRAGDDAGLHVLALARKLAGMPSANVRLLIFGDASEAFWHTGVVDVVPQRRHGKDVISDCMLASLAGCTELLAPIGTPVPDGIACTRLSKHFDLAEWFQRWILATGPSKRIAA